MVFTDISKQLSISEATLRYRVQHLLQSGIVQIHACLNPQKLGMPHIVTLRLNVERDRITAGAETLVSVTAIQFVAIVTGHYTILMDALLAIRSPDSNFDHKPIWNSTARAFDQAPQH